MFEIPTIGKMKEDSPPFRRRCYLFKIICTSSATTAATLRTSSWCQNLPTYSESRPKAINDSAVPSIHVCATEHSRAVCCKPCVSYAAVVLRKYFEVLKQNTLEHRDDSIKSGSLVLRRWAECLS